MKVMLYAKVNRILRLYFILLITLGIITTPLAGNFLSDQIALEFQQRLKIQVTPTYKVIKKKSVEVGKPADATLRKVNVTESFDQAAKMVSDCFIYLIGSNLCLASH